MSEPRVVLKRGPQDDPHTILATTYQMRNPFRQFADAVATELDTLCYFEHQQAAELCPPGGRVLDVCSGRGLLIPFLRYHAQPSIYCGVDLAPQNAVWRNGVDPRPTHEQTTWPFATYYVESNVAAMTDPVRAVCPDPFNLIVFTSSIEHMQPSAQQAALQCCHDLAARQAVLYLTCPVTPAGQSGYKTQYAAHVYEPSDDELLTWLAQSGWTVRRRWGLVTKTRFYRETLAGPALANAERLYKTMPRPLALCAIAALYPQCALEVAYLCSLAGE